jgi:hypothetical protein
VARSREAHQRLAAAERATGSGGPRRAALWAVWWLPTALGLGLLAGCGGGPAVQVQDTSGEPWVARDDTCVRELSEGPVRRVINRVDPELCGRWQKHRSDVYVRVLPPPGTRSP